MGGNKIDRERIQTLNFFGQAPTNTCLCNKRSCRDAQASLKESDSKLDAACNEFAAAIDSLGRDGRIEEDEQDTINDRLHLDSFNMASLDETIVNYENSHELFRRTHVDKLSSLWERIKEGKVMGFRGNPSRITQMDFELVDRFFQKWNEYLNYGICLAQLYNIEKRFGSFPDQSRWIELRAVARVDEKTEEPLPTLRQKFNDPTSFMENRFFKKPKERPRKYFHIPEVLTEQTRLCTIATKDVKVLNILVPRYEAKVPHLPMALYYRSSRLPPLPTEVHLALNDLNYLHLEVQDSYTEILGLREKVRYVAMIWATTSEAAWEYGKKHIRQLPVMREYEYRRTSLWAEYTVIFRSETKVLKFFQSDKYQKGSNAKIEAAVGIDRTAADIEDEWKKRWQMLESTFKTVTSILQEIEDLKRSMKKHWDQVEEEMSMILSLSKK